MSDTNPPAKKFTVTLRRTQVQTVTFVLENYNDNPPLAGIAQGYCWPSKWEDEDVSVAHTDSHVVTIIDREANENYDEAPDQGRIEPGLGNPSSWTDQPGNPPPASWIDGADDGPHSRACGPTPHPHGSSCHTNCPTCGGRNEYNK